MLRKRPRMVLVDLDGTMVDSVPDLAFCVDEMMRRLGRVPWGEARVREWVGNGVERLVKRSLTGQLDAEPDADLYAEAYPIFLDLYAENTSARSHLFPGVKVGLEYLSNAGLKLGCVTNKAKRFTEPLLQHLGVRDFFGIVISGDCLPQRKPDPAPLVHAAQHFGVRPADALMLGDSVSDVKAARAAGFPIVCVSYGYNHGQDIHSAQPDAVIDSLAELSGLLEPLPEGKSVA